MRLATLLPQVRGNYSYVILHFEALLFKVRIQCLVVSALHLPLDGMCDSLGVLDKSLVQQREIPR